MEKKACIDLLNQKGFLTQESDGVITIQLGDLPEKERNRKMAEIAELIKEKGYIGSYGFRWKNENATAGKKSVTKKETDFDLHLKEEIADEIGEAGSVMEEKSLDFDESGEGQISFIL